MYTSINPISDRFGFKVNGTFKCAFKNERVILIAGLVPVAAFVVLIIISAIDYAGLFKPNGAIKDGLFEVITEGGEATVRASPGFINFSVGIWSFGFSAIVLAVLLLAYLVLVLVMRAGRSYKFEANENGMSIIFPDGREESFLYKDVIAVKDTERKFLFGSRGLNVNVKTKSGDYTYCLVHTPLSRVNGVVETPFNIVKERAELTNERDEFFYRGV